MLSEVFLQKSLTRKLGDIKINQNAFVHNKRIHLTACSRERYRKISPRTLLRVNKERSPYTNVVRGNANGCVEINSDP